MIFCDKITEIPSKITLKLPTSVPIFDKNIKIIELDGGSSFDVDREDFNCGDSNEYNRVDIDLMYSDDVSSLNKVLVTLRHKVTNKVYSCRMGVTDQNSLVVFVPFRFEEIPNVGEYYVKATFGYELVYEGVLRIGEIENKNKSYKLIDRDEQYER